MEKVIKIYDKDNVKMLGVVPLDEIGGGGNSGGIVVTTYANLKSMRDGGTLAPGAWYRITDYVTTTTQVNTQSAGNVFDVIVRADDAHTLNENAFACVHNGDTYFTEAGANLAAWELKYDLDNDTAKYAWANSENGKGVIWWMKDEKGNECPYDFKNIQFKVDNVFYYTFSIMTNGEVFDHSFNKACYGNKMGIYYNDSVKRSLNENVLLGGTGINASCYNNIFGNNCYNNFLEIGCFSNSFGYNCQSNTLGSSCRYNSFGIRCNSNKLGANCDNNKFGDSCTLHNIGKNCTRNSFGFSCAENSLESSCDSNNFGTACSGNSLKHGCHYNRFGDYCMFNRIGAYCESISFGIECQKNIFGVGNSGGCGECDCGGDCGCGCGGESTVYDYYRNIIFDNGCSNISLKATTTSQLSYCQNVHVMLGVKNKTVEINDADLNSTYTIEVYPLNSKVLNV